MSWPKAALGDVFEIARGGSPRPIEKFLTDEADGLNWVSISDATRSGKIIERTERKIRPEGLAKSRWVEPGDFLLSNSMSFGRPYIMGTTGCIHDGWLVLKPGKTPVDPNYLYHLLNSEPVFAQFAKRATGTTVKNLNTQIVSETVIPLPPLPEQRRIAAILDQADALRRLRRQSLARLADLRQAIFMKMFGQLDGTSRPLGELASKIGSGATPKGGNATYQTSGTPFVRSMNVRDGWFDDNGLAFLSSSQAAKLDNVTLATDDVLLNITGASVARVCRAPHQVTGGRVNQHVSIIRPSSSVLPSYLEAYLLHPPIKRRLLGLADSGATRQAITKTQIENLEIYVPPIEDQQNFDRILRENDAVASHSSKSLTSLDSLFTSLQHRAFRGDL